jgi:hypothetical protein
MTLARLRVRLTLWYAATFVVILLLLGIGVFVAIEVQVARRLDVSLSAAAAAIMRATRDWEAERTAGQTADAVEELRIPDRDLYLLDVQGHPITPSQADAWVTSAAVAAARSGRVDTTHRIVGRREQQLHAERFTAPSGTPYVAVAVAERPGIADQYGWLIGTFGAAAVLLVGGQGRGLSVHRKAAAPVDRATRWLRAEVDGREAHDRGWRLRLRSGFRRNGGKRSRHHQNGRRFQH